MVAVEEKEEEEEEGGSGGRMGWGIPHEANRMTYS